MFATAFYAGALVYSKSLQSAESFLFSSGLYFFSVYMATPFFCGEDMKMPVGGEVLKKGRDTVYRVVSLLFYLVILIGSLFALAFESG